MKIIFLACIALLCLVSPVYGQLLSDATGLVNRLDIQSGGYSFEVEIVSNFDIQNFEFDKYEKKLTLFISSGLKNNLGEVIIPQNLLGGNLTFYLNDKEYFPKVNTNEKISFVTLNFTGSGNNQLEIIGTTHFFGLSEETETPQSNLVSPTDYDLIYTIVMVLLIVGAIAGVIIFKLKQGRK